MSYRKLVRTRTVITLVPRSRKNKAFSVVLYGVETKDPEVNTHVRRLLDSYPGYILAGIAKAPRSVPPKAVPVEDNRPAWGTLWGAPK